jgi:D-3-phosphoglycerate dehydrogenase / 2-oxoglutarate reductase
MPKPGVYIHSIYHADNDCAYDDYMDDANEALLASFATVTNHGRREQPLSEGELVEALRGARGILSLNGTRAGQITAGILGRVGTVEVAVVAHWWHGISDEAAATWRTAGVLVVDASDACNAAVAEWTIGAAIAGLRRFEHFDREMKAGTLWPEREGVVDQLIGSTFGIVGLGRIGKLVARFLQPFSTTVIGYDPYIERGVAMGLGVELVDLDALLRRADVVSLHLPVTPETKTIIGARELETMKDGALLINCARAALVDGQALRFELARNRLRAYLDVFDPEPPAPDDVLRILDNVVMTPHIAGHTRRMFLSCGRLAIEALRGHLV